MAGVYRRYLFWQRRHQLKREWVGTKPASGVVTDTLTSSGQESDSISNESLVDSQSGAGTGVHTFTEATAETDSDTFLNTQSLSLDADVETDTSTGVGSQSLSSETGTETTTNTGSNSQTFAEAVAETDLNAGLNTQVLSIDATVETVTSSASISNALSIDATADTDKSTSTGSQSIGDGTAEAVTNVTTGTSSLTKEAIAEGASNSALLLNFLVEPDFCLNSALAIHSILETIVPAGGAAPEQVIFGSGSPGHMMIFGGRPRPQQKDAITSQFEASITLIESIHIPELSPDDLASQNFALARIRRRRREEELVLQDLL